jgi:hypothetical protein
MDRMIADDFAGIRAGMRDGTTLGDALEASAAAHRAQLHGPNMRFPLVPLVKITNLAPPEPVMTVMFLDTHGDCLRAFDTPTATLKWGADQDLRYHRAVGHIYRMPPEWRAMLGSRLRVRLPMMVEINESRAGFIRKGDTLTITVLPDVSLN